MGPVLIKNYSWAFLIDLKRSSLRAAHVILSALKKCESQNNWDAFVVHFPEHKFMSSADKQEAYLKSCPVWLFSDLLPPAGLCGWIKDGTGRRDWLLPMEIVTPNQSCTVSTSPLPGLRCAGHLQFIKPQLCRGVFSGRRQHLTAGVGGIHRFLPPGSPRRSRIPWCSLQYHSQNAAFCVKTECLRAWEQLLSAKPIANEFS